MNLCFPTDGGQPMTEAEALRLVIAWFGGDRDRAERAWDREGWALVNEPAFEEPAAR